MSDYYQNIMQPLLAIIFAVGGIGAVVVTFTYWLFKLFSDKWLTAKFNERLEDHKHAQQKELENVRFEFDKLMDRTVKLHQREFDTLPEAWALLVEAHGISRAVTSSMQSYPDVNRMNEAQLDELLADSPLLNWQREEIKNSSDKNIDYQKASDFHKLSMAEKAARDFHLYRLKHGIFMPQDICNNLEHIDNLIFEANHEQGFQLEHGINYKERNARKKLKDEGTASLKKLESDIRKCLWD